MAVTYAWRLDANKYAYILSPGDGLTPNQRYGYVSETTLVGDDLNTVAQTANSWFGENGSQGFSGYKQAYNAMIEKIKNKWGNGAEFYDLLSADVYYNVDSYNCADLRGVGIKGIKYLGACNKDTFNFENPSWDPTIKINETAKLQGMFSVYGVYMDDQTTNDAIDVAKTPENIFVVYNGADGRNNDGSASTATLEGLLQSEVTRSTNADNDHNTRIATLESAVATLSQLNGGSLVDLIARLAAVEAKANTITALENRIAALEARLDSNEESGSGAVTGTTGGVVIDGAATNSGYYNVLAYDTESESVVYLDDYYVRGKKLYSTNGYYDESN